MFGKIIGAVAGAIIGGVVSGVTTSKNNKIKINALEKAAKDMRKATEEYSGKKALEKMYNAGLQGSYNYGTSMGNEMASQAFTPQNPGSTGAGTNSSAMMAGEESGKTAKNAAIAGFNSGMNNEAEMNAAKYNQAGNKANLELKQADIDYNVANQKAQNILGGIENITDAVSEIGNPFENLTSGRAKRGKPVEIKNSNPFME